MKESKLIVALFLSLNISLAQTSFCPPGAVWHFNEKLSLSGREGIVTFNYTKDTLIQTKVCKKIIGEFSGLLTTPSTPVLIPNYITHFLREENHVIYVFNHNKFDTVINFNAHIGDKWLSLKRPNDTQSPQRAVIVVDTDHVVINNQSLKRLKLNYVYGVLNNPPTLTLTTYAIENIYFFSGLNLSPSLVPYFAEKSIQSDSPRFNFLCYQDAGFGSYKLVESCNTITHLNESSFNGSTFITQPNPVKDQFFLTVKTSSGNNLHGAYFELIDALGRVMPILPQSDEMPDGSYTFDMSKFNEGYYTFVINGTERVKIIKD